MSFPQSKPIGIRELANQLSLSVGTVSRALNNQPGVREQTRKRVLRTAQKEGYVPDAQAKFFRTRRSRQIGIILPSLDDPTYVEKIRSAHRTAWGLGYDVAFVSTEWGVDREVTACRHLLSRGVEGLIALSMTPLEANLRAIAERGVKVLLINSIPQRFEDVATIDVDASAGIAQACQHLLELGHRRIGLLGFRSGVGSSSHAPRISAVCQAARKAGLTDDHVSLIPTDADTIKAGYEGVTRRLQSEDPFPTAIQAINDYVALGGIRALADARIRVPDDVSVVGFGNVDLVQMTMPRLTSVSFTHLDLGAVAVRMVVHAIENPDADPECICLKTKLVVRESTAPPPM